MRAPTTRLPVLGATAPRECGLSEIIYQGHEMYVRMVLDILSHAVL